MATTMMLQNNTRSINMADSKPVVLVTGASGFIATHVMKALHDTGKYTLRGTAREKSKEKLQSNLKDLGIEAEIFGCDLLDDAGWDAAIEGFDYILH